MSGIFSRLAQGISKAGEAGEKYFLKPMAETFVSPVGRAFERPFVETVKNVQQMVPGGKTGLETVKTPFGEVKPYAAMTQKEQITKPLGETFEVATSIPGVAGKIAGAGIKVATKALGPLAKPAGELVQKAGTAIVKSAERTYGQALAPTIKTLKVATERVTPEALKQGIAGTTGQIVKKAKQGLEKAGQAIEDFGELKGSTAVKKIEDVFESAKQQFKVNEVIVNKNAVAAIDEVSKTVRQLADETGEVPREALRAVRRIWDNEVAQAGGFLGKTLKEGSDVAIKKLGSDTIRNLLAEEIPDLKKLNANFNFYRNLLDISEATKTRRIGQTGLLRQMAGAGIGTILGQGTGVPFGEWIGVGAGKMVASISGSTLFKSLSAVAKNKLGKALIDGEHSLPKIAEWISNKAAFPALKVKDFYKFLDEEAKKSQEEIQNDWKTHDAKIEQLRATLFGDEKTSNLIEKGSQFTPEEKKQRDEQLKQILFGNE